jgi:hypothetical protein
MTQTRVLGQEADKKLLDDFDFSGNSNIIPLKGVTYQAVCQKKSNRMLQGFQICQQVKTTQAVQLECPSCIPQVMI